MTHPYTGCASLEGTGEVREIRFAECLIHGAHCCTAMFPALTRNNCTIPVQKRKKANAMKKLIIKKTIKPAAKVTKKVAPKQGKVEQTIEQVKPNNLLNVLNGNGGEIRIEFIKVDGTPRTYGGFCKPDGKAATGNKLNFNLTGDWSDSRSWRGSRLDCIVRLAFKMKTGKWCVANFRTPQEAQRNAAAALAARNGKRQNPGDNITSTGLPF